MKTIKLTNAPMYALVDSEDHEYLSQFKWRLIRHGYAARSQWIPENKISTIIYMHREILETPPGMDTEHINMNKLDNRKDNLRVGSRSQNMANIQARKGCLSQYKGVSYLKRVGKWVAYIRKDYKQIHLGYFEKEKDAARAYDDKAKELFGEFASTNF